MDTKEKKTPFVIIISTASVAALVQTNNAKLTSHLQLNHTQYMPKNSLFFYYFVCHTIKKNYLYVYIYIYIYINELKNEIIIRITCIYGALSNGARMPDRTSEGKTEK